MSIFFNQKSKIFCQFFLPKIEKFLSNFFYKNRKNFVKFFYKNRKFFVKFFYKNRKFFVKIFQLRFRLNFLIRKVNYWAPTIWVMSRINAFRPISPIDSPKLISTMMNISILTKNSNSSVWWYRLHWRFSFKNSKKISIFILWSYLVQFFTLNNFVPNWVTKI